MKENEIEYLHKEIGCLRNELQFLNTVQCAHFAFDVYRPWKHSADIVQTFFSNVPAC